MSVQLINNFVLLPDPPNYQTPPEWQRAWQTEISSAVAGNESRQALRAQPRQRLTWLITPWTIQEQSQLDDRLRAAKKAGTACSALWGRGSKLSADLTSMAVSLSSSSTSFAIGDYIYIATAPAPGNYAFNVRQISDVSGNNLTLSVAVSQTFKAGLLVWPMLFGKFESQDMSIETGRRGSIQVSISEMIAPATTTIGTNTNDASDGIGAWKIGTTFEVQ